MDDLHSELHNKLAKIEKVFDTSKVISVESNLKSIARYYKINKLAYTIFHHGNDFIHMGISRTGKFRNTDLLEQAKLVERYILKLDAKNILELATGRGATSAYLASTYPTITFNAMDLPDGQLDYAVKKAKKIPNFIPIISDYHDLSSYQRNSMDIVFVIEALCYSSTKQQVYKEVKRVLKKKGIFIIFDGYGGRPDKKLTKEEMLAKKLTEKGMIVNNFDYYPDVKEELMHAGFTIVEEEDASLYILPTLKKFERQAKKYFSIPVSVAKSINEILPNDFTYNALSGYLMPTLIELGVAKYIITVAQS